MARSIFLQEGTKNDNLKNPNFGQLISYYKKVEITPYKLNQGNKHPLLFKIEKILYKYYSPKSGLDIFSLAKDKESVTKIEKLFTEKFNLSSFTLNLVTPTSVEIMNPAFLLVPNAYTYGSSADIERIIKAPPIRFFSSINYEKGDIRFKYPCHSSFITINPLLSVMLTPEEFVAIILHEIGHDFYEYGPIATSLILVKYCSDYFKNLLIK